MENKQKKDLSWSKEDLDEIQTFLSTSKNEKIIRFTQFELPSESTILIDGLSMKTYRYPHQGENLKGIVFYVHGFTDYVGRFAHLG